MLILLGFAFMAGIVTILSPCILPVLPIILSGAVPGDQRRPLGIVIGFVVSFTFFTLALATLVKAIGISTDSLRTVAVVVLFILGLTLISSKLTALFERLVSPLTRLVPASKPTSSKDTNQGGFWSGFLIGLSLGLIWTPCVGPIIAAVITLAATASVTTTTVFITLFYALGTAVPMLIIMYAGRGILNRNKWLLNRLNLIKVIFGVLVIITAVAIQFNYDRKFQQYILEKFPSYGANLTRLEENDLVKNALEKLRVEDLEKSEPNGKMAPEIIPAGDWHNTEPLTMESLRGKADMILRVKP
jgi:cytochrome c biogenesis protein CcdA